MEPQNLPHIPMTGTVVLQATRVVGGGYALWVPVYQGFALVHFIQQSKSLSSLYLDTSCNHLWDSLHTTVGVISANDIGELENDICLNPSLCILEAQQLLMC